MDMGYSFRFDTADIASDSASSDGEESVVGELWTHVYTSENEPAPLSSSFVEETIDESNAAQVGLN